MNRMVGRVPGEDLAEATSGIHWRAVGTIAQIRAAQDSEIGLIGLGVAGQCV
jgi:hypothetical protein